MDFQTICRVCTREHSRMLSIFDHYNFSAYNDEIFKVITACASVQIHKFDGFSEQICRRCLVRLSEAYSFKRLCEDSDYKFRNNLIVPNIMDINNELSKEDAFKIICDEIDINSITENAEETIKPLSGAFETMECKSPSGVKDAQCTENDKSEYYIPEIISTDIDSCITENLDEDITIIQKGQQPGKVFEKMDFKVINDFIENNIIKVNNEEEYVIDYDGITTESLDINDESSNVIVFEVTEDPTEECSTEIKTQNKSDAAPDEIGEVEEVQIDTVSVSSDVFQEIGNKKRRKPHKNEKCSSEIKTQNKGDIDPDVIEDVKVHTASISCDVFQKIGSKKRRNPPKNIKRFKCKLCIKSYAEKRSLILHMQSHKGSNPSHQCQRCSKTFATTELLTLHMEVHQVERPKKKSVVCNICGKKLAGRSTLTNHMRIHTGERPYKCKICEKTFAISNNLRHHLKSHSEERPFKCDVCDRGFKYRCNLRKHKVVHSTDNEISEEEFVIDYGGVNSETLDINDESNNAIVLEVTQETTEECSTEIKTQNKSDADPDEIGEVEEVQIDTVSVPSDVFQEIGDKNRRKPPKNVTRFECKLCIKSYAEKRSLILHMQSHKDSNSSNQCQHCSKTFATTELLTLHMEVHRVERQKKKSVVCNICGKKLTESSSLTKHMRIHTGERPHKCKICEKTFATRYNLRIHLKSHSEERPFKCDICDRGFKNRCNLRNHKVVHSTDNEISEVDDVIDFGGINTESLDIKDESSNAIVLEVTQETTEECSTEIKTQNKSDAAPDEIGEVEEVQIDTVSVPSDVFQEIGYKNKRKTPKNVTRFECKLCIKSYAEKRSLILHMQSHKESNSSHQCQRCSKTFATTELLTVHMEIHRVDRPKKKSVVCNICGKKLTESSSLTKHMRIHTGERPHKCEICEKTFATRYNLRIHLKSHSEERPFKCDICDRGFKNRCNLRNHKIVHSTDNEISEVDDVIDFSGINTESLDIKDEGSNVEVTQETTEECSTEIKTQNKSDANPDEIGEVEEVQKDTASVPSDVFQEIDYKKRRKTPKNVTRFECKLCIKSYAEKRSLILHMQSHKESNSSHQCQRCSKTFATTELLTLHMEVHRVEKPKKKSVVCNICGKKLTESSSLTKHMRIHTGERPHKCEICEKTFATRYNLRIHLKSHSEERPFKCDICDRGFKNRCNLRNHKVVHSTDKEISKVDDVIDYGGINTESLEIKDESSNVEVTQETTEECSTEIKTQNKSDADPDEIREVEEVQIDTASVPSDLFQKIDYKKRRNPPRNVTRFKCKLCIKSYAEKRSLLLHMQSHKESNSSHQCKLCRETYATTELLTLHMEVHRVDRPTKKSVACNICDKKLTGSNLTKHMRIHTGERPYKCEICEKTFATSGNLHLHFKSHSEERPFKCDVCDRGFKNRCNLRKHKIVHSTDKEILKEEDAIDFGGINTESIDIKDESSNVEVTQETTEKCSSEIGTQNKGDTDPDEIEVKVDTASIPTDVFQNIGYKQRKKPPKNVIPFKCELCSKSYAEKRSLILHMQSHEESKSSHQCKLCSKTFATAESLTLHMNVHQADGPEKKSVVCNICDKELSQKSQLKKHMRIHTGERPYKCDICDKSFQTKHNLGIHLRSHSDERPFKCEVCDRGFKDPCALRKHKIVHSNKKYTCRFCRKEFEEKLEFVSHVALHKRERRFHCELCDKVYLQKDGLMKHMASHSGEKQYNCTHCDKKYSLADSLREHHKKDHSEANQKKFRCKFCNKDFTKKLQLVSHMKTHTRNKWFHCELCDKKFLKRQGLITHMATHSDEKRYQCACCEKKFSRADYLVKHHRRIHASEANLNS